MVCLDTSFVIDLLRKSPAINDLKDNIDSSGELVFLPSPVLTELVSGLNLKNKEKELNAVNSLLSRVVILNLDKESAWRAGEIESDLRMRGELIDIEDIMISAIALENKETLVTRNKKHFEKIKGLNLIGY